MDLDNGIKKSKYPPTGSSVGFDVREECSDFFNMIGREQQLK